MKVTLILFVSFIFLEACSSSKGITGNTMQVTKATAKQWSEPPVAGSDIPEVGTDLTITVEHWPEEYTPEYVVYNYRKSFPATVTDSTAQKVIITARIIRTSGMMEEKSESVYLSDRLVFTTPEGKSDFIEIDSWEQAED